MSGRLRSKSAPSVLIPQYVTADTVIADYDIPDPSALRTFSNASTVVADDGEEVPQSDYDTMAEREAAEHAATKIQAVERGRNYRKSKKGGRRKTRKKDKKKRDITRKTKKRGGDTTAGILEKVKKRKEIQNPAQRWREAKKDLEARKRRKKLQDHYKTILDTNLPKTKKAIEKRDKRHEKFSKATFKKPIVEPVSDKNIFGFERSAEKVDKLTEKKQKKSDKVFDKNLQKQLNIAIKDPSHPDHFKYRRRRLLEIIRNKHKKEYDSFLKCKDKGLTSNPGCSMEIYKAIEPNGEKRGDKLLDAIAEKYGITPDMEKYKKVKKGISAKKRSASAGRKRRNKTKKKRNIITRKKKRKTKRRKR